jgi:hypothetical protein
MNISVHIYKELQVIVSCTVWGSNINFVLKVRSERNSFCFHITCCCHAWHGMLLTDVRYCTLDKVSINDHTRIWE